MTRRSDAKSVSRANGSGQRIVPTAITAGERVELAALVVDVLVVVEVTAITKESEEAAFAIALPVVVRIQSRKKATRV
jgi:hypothetical protein